jgi:hypothetical protein
MTFYAHTAELPDGSRDPEQSHWQKLATHLRNVADLAKEFAAPPGLTEETELAGHSHDL